MKILQWPGLGHWTLVVTHPRLALAPAPPPGHILTRAPVMPRIWLWVQNIYQYYVFEYAGFIRQKTWAFSVLMAGVVVKEGVVLRLPHPSTCFLSDASKYVVTNIMKLDIFSYLNNEFQPTKNDIGWKSILSFIMILGAGSADRDLCCIMYTHMLCWGMPEMPLAQECAMYYSEWAHKHKQGGEWSRQEVQSVRSSDQDQIRRLGLQNCIVQNSKHGCLHHWLESLNWTSLESDCDFQENIELIETSCFVITTSLNDILQSIMYKEECCLW